MERSLVILKPDAVQRELMGAILQRLEQRGLRIIGMKMMVIDRERAEKHYAEHHGKGFYPGLVEYITSGPSVVLAIAGEGVIQTIRDMVGKTNPVEAAPGTIRFDYALVKGRNLIHASDSPQSGEREIGIFFEQGELLPGSERALDRWIFE